MSLFFFDFWVALSAPRDGLICNPSPPAQAKHTLSVSHFFWKVAPNRPNIGSILEAFLIKNHNFEWKKGSKKLFKTRVPPHWQMRSYDHGPGLPDSPPRVRGFLNKKQLSEQETRTGAHFWVHFWAVVLEWVISESISGKFVIFWWNLKQKKTNNWGGFRV